METWQEVLQKELDRLARGARGQVRPGALPRARPAAAGGRELRVPDLAGDGRSDQVARRPDLAAVRPDGRGARRRRRHRRLAQRGRATARCPTSPTAIPTARSSSSPRSAPPTAASAPGGGRWAIPRRSRCRSSSRAFQYLEAAHRDPRRHHVGRRSAAAQRPAARGHPHPAPGHPAPRDHPDREPDPLPPARADHARALRHAQEVPPALHQHPLQPPRRADARRRWPASACWPTPASRSAARRCCSRA